MVSNNAGIIIYRETKLPQLLSILAAPKLEGSITIRDETKDINIYIYDCPVNGLKLDKKRYRMLRELVEESKIKFLVERFEAKVSSNVTPKNNELHYSQLLVEISAIKQLAALIKLSQEQQVNFCSGTIGFITGNVDSLKIDLLSEEATSVMMYEGHELSEKHKLKLHKDFMEKKGISIIFSKSIKDIIDNSTVISIDEQVDLRGYEDALNSKVLLGKGSSPNIKGIHNIVLWPEELDKHGGESIPIYYNNEILAIMRYYNMNLDIIDFIKKFPYIYFDLQAD